MRTRLERKLTSTWYGRRTPGPVLRTLAWCYGHAYRVAQHRERKAYATDLVGAPIVVVGNLTAGGAGKTPLVIHLCRLLRDAGFNPGVISRGYGRRSRGAVLVEDGHDADEVGDEPLLIHESCGIPVLVSEDRCGAARGLFRLGVDVVVSDDGLQRRRLPRVIEVCVVDGQRGFGNGRLLPAGPLREPMSVLKTLDHVLSNGDAQHPSIGTVDAVIRLQAGRPLSLCGMRGAGIEELARQSGDTPLEAIAGIGHPARFFATLEAAGIHAHHHAFPDHHRFSREDFRQLEGRTLIMTAKDAIKCRKLGLENAWYLPVEAVTPVAWNAEFLRSIARVTGREERQP
ncbi:MAG: tetraacyldisaccharide 4'-kinase [Xanthomonadales bacterium]|nr:tetraacyldisaccharide 4'-kinase [Xanthomonadales bacterium]NIX13140.1 tetraacyldisaccharide 4'-kinase [Xanthomonadales bacterium]